MEPLCGRWGDDVFKQFKTILKSVEKSLILGKRIIVVYIWNKCPVACYGTQILRSSLWYPSVKMSSKARDVYYPLDRSNHSCSVKKGVLKNFAKFTGKHLC